MVQLIKKTTKKDTAREDVTIKGDFLKARKQSQSAHEPHELILAKTSDRSDALMEHQLLSYVVDCGSSSLLGFLGNTFGSYVFINQQSPPYVKPQTS